MTDTAYTEIDESVQEDRYDNYESLSRLFRIEIDADLLKDLCESPIVEATGDEAFDEGYAAMRAYLDGIDDLSKGKSELAIDYAYIFLGYGGDPNGEEVKDETAMHAAYPYESVYTTGSKTLTGGLSEEVTVTYNEQGFHPTRYRIAADDHMACELEFLHFLVGQEILAAREGDLKKAAELREVEAKFIDGHPAKWIGAFSDAIDARAQTVFYRALAKMTQGWLAQDRAFLEEVSCGE